MLPELRDRHLNGSVHFAPTVQGKVMRVTLHEAKFATHVVPEDYEKWVSSFIESNAANRLLGDPVIGPVLIKTETMKVENNSLEFTRQ
jgi:hypothetical protein